MKDKPLIISFILLLSTNALPQQAFEHISSAQGLSSDKVADIIQDRDGFYWIATAEGLNRFDGSTFKVYRHDKNDSTSLSHNNNNISLGKLSGGTYHYVLKARDEKNVVQECRGIIVIMN